MHATMLCTPQCRATGSGAGDVKQDHHHVLTLRQHSQHRADDMVSGGVPSCDRRGGVWKAV